MKGWPSVLWIAAGLLVASAVSAPAQESGKEVLISIYRVAPGKHLDFLKWVADRDAVGREAGGTPAQYYVHENGDSWDFISIAEQLDPEKQAALDKKVESLTKQKGMTTGFAAGLEFRQFMASHTDTFAAGPFTAAELVDRASGR
jgi:hypothetical protein